VQREGSRGDDRTTNRLRHRDTVCSFLQKAAGSNLPLSHLVTAGGTAAPGGNEDAVFTFFSLHQQPPNFALQPTVARHSQHRCAVQYSGRATAAERWSVAPQTHASTPPHPPF
jgi:hypothetical protein